MVFDLIPIIIILVSLAMVVFIVVKKFPQMASVDTDQIPEEKSYLSELSGQEKEKESFWSLLSSRKIFGNCKRNW